MAPPPNFSELELRRYIKFREIFEITSKSIDNELVIVYRDDALSYSTVIRWVNLFRVVEFLSKITLVLVRQN